MKLIYTIALLFFIAFNANSQNGLEKIIVEKYYITDANDAANEDGGKIEENTTTYRIYVDMLPNYILQAVYGSDAHDLVIETSDKFFNNEARGAVSPTYTKTQAKANTVMLDTWISVGAACKDNLGVLKNEDNGVETVINSNNILQNDDPIAGVPVKTQDGMIAGKVEQVTLVNIDDKVIMFDGTNDTPAPNKFLVNNGAWASVNGSKGKDSLTNKVLIGQFTTKGTFGFSLNLQIRNQSTFGVEKYVASNPKEDEKVDSSLTYFVDPLVSVDYTQLETQFKLFPNPTTSTVNFEMPLNVHSTSYSLTSINGEVIKNGKLPNINRHSLDVSDIPAGLYILKINVDGNTYHSKINKI